MSALVEELYEIGFRQGFEEQRGDTFIRLVDMLEADIKCTRQEAEAQVARVVLNADRERFLEEGRKKQREIYFEPTVSLLMRAGYARWRAEDLVKEAFQTADIIAKKEDERREAFYQAITQADESKESESERKEERE